MRTRIHAVYTGHGEARTFTGRGGEQVTTLPVGLLPLGQTETVTAYVTNAALIRALADVRPLTEVHVTATVRADLVTPRNSAPYAALKVRVDAVEVATPAAASSPWGEDEQAA